MSKFLDEADNPKWDVIARWIAGTILGIIGFIFALWVVVGLVAPQLRLYKANTEKRAAIAEARAQSDAAEYQAERAVEIATAEAQADRVRAEGIADAQQAIDATLTPEYIQWYFVDKLDDVDDQIIYVPSGSGLPLPEAGRAVPQGER